MTKKDISKILIEGSCESRLILIFEEMARSIFTTEKMLTDDECYRIANSFKSAAEIKRRKEFSQADAVVHNAIINLQTALFTVRIHYSDLRSYILLLSYIDNTELLVNSVLHEVKTPKEREMIAKKAAKGACLILNEIKTDDEGYIEISLDSNYVKDDKGSFLNLMNNAKQSTIKAIIKFLSWKAAILDYMKDKGFNIKTYKDKIQEMTDQVYDPILKWEECEDSFSIYNPLLDKLKSKYFITPNIRELKVDVNEYNEFKELFLDREQKIIMIKS